MQRKINVLIVDNSLDFSDILKCYFEEQEDFNVIGTAHNGVDAIDKINTYNPDVVLLDIIMPGMSGLEVLEKISLSAASKKPIVIMLSAIGKEEVIKQALDLGCSLYFIKPISIDFLISRIRQYINPCLE